MFSLGHLQIGVWLNYAVKDSWYQFLLVVLSEQRFIYVALKIISAVSGYSTEANKGSDDFSSSLQLLQMD